MRQMETHLTSFIVLGLFFMCSPVLFPLCRVNARRHVLGGIFVFEIKRLTLWKTERKPEKLKMFSAQSRGIISPQNFHLNSLRLCCMQGNPLCICSLCPEILTWYDK